MLPNTLSKPESRGRVRLRSAQAEDAPRMRFNYLQQDSDLRCFRDGARLTREIMAQPAFDPYRGPEIRPGPKLVDDNAIDAWIRETANTQYHPCGSCRMGNGDNAVVDPQTRVHGTERLRVVDSSIMPFITNANLNAPTIMIAEKAADMILGKPALAPSDAPAYDAPDWGRAQRTGPELRK